jgi:hypothetical protein
MLIAAVTHWERIKEETFIRDELQEYIFSIDQFVSQSWVLMSDKNSEILNESFESFMPSKAQCAKVIRDPIVLAQFGSCILSPSEKSVSLGWQSHGSVLTYTKSYPGKVLLYVVLDNPDFIQVRGSRFLIDLGWNHLVRGLPLVGFICSFFLIIFLLYRFLKSLKKESIESQDRLHDLANQIEDQRYLSKKMEKMAHDPMEILHLSQTIQADLSLKEALLYQGLPNEIIPWDLNSLLKEFYVGFFKNRDSSLFMENNPSENLTVMVDKRILYRVLYNLFDNAYRESIGYGTFTLTLLSDQNQVRLILVNDGVIPDPHKIFQRGQSYRGSSGKGLAIVRDSLRSMGSEINLLEIENKVCFSFTLKKEPLL